MEDSTYTTTRKKALPGISLAHCPQTLIPHMPVPPQETAPSLSPRQSIDCQSPLPWVTGIDRTGSLQALWQLQGSFQEFSSPSAHSLTWRSRSLANKPHTVQYCVVTTTHGKHRPRLPKMVQQSQDDITVMISEQGSTHRLAQLFPNNQGFFHSSSTRGFCSGNALLRLSRQTHTHNSGQGCTRIPQGSRIQSSRFSEQRAYMYFHRTNTGFTTFRDEPG